MMEQGMRRIGYLYACIAGDHRYASIIHVHLCEDGSVEVTRKENGAVGGMDGPGAAYTPDVRHRERIAAKDVTPRAVADAVRGAYDHIIDAYGKPTKNFEWSLPGRERLNGVSQAKIARVLKAWAS